MKNNFFSLFLKHFKKVLINDLISPPASSNKELNERKGDGRVTTTWKSDPASLIEGYAMRDLLFKNLTSDDKKRKVISSSEIVDKSGVRTIVRRHFIYFAREVEDNQVAKHTPYLFVLKKRNTKERKEKFYCRMKGSVYAVCQGRLFLVQFMHSLKISIVAIPKQTIKYCEEENWA